MEKTAENTKEVEKKEEEAVNGEKDESKVSDDEVPEGDDTIVDEEGDEVNEAHAKALQETTCVKTWGFKRTGKLEEDIAAWYKFFKDDVKVEVPLIQTPGVDDQWIIFKMKSIEDKRKMIDYVKKNKFNGNKIRVKAIAQRESKKDVVRTKLTEEQALDILYPARNTLYADQLKEKQEKIKKLVEEDILPMKNIKKYSASKKYFKSINTDEIVPLTTIDGYENNVLIHVEKNAETGEVDYGLLAVDKAGASAIVPLEKCLSIPRQMAVISKGVVSGLISNGLEPYEPVSREGEFMGFVLRISDQATFMLTVVIKKPEGIAFHEISPEGIVLKEGEGLGESYREMMEKKMTECKEKIIKFYEAEGKTLSIQSVYAVLATDFVLQYQTSAKYNLPSAVHVAGDQHIIEKLNGTLVKVHWDREGHTEVVKSVLSLFDPSIFNNKTTVYLASPIKQIGYYFAKTCGHVTQIGFWYKDVINKYTAEARKEGLKNIDYINYHAKLKKPATFNSVVIWWPVLGATIGRKIRRLTCLQQFLEHNFSHMIFISYWNRANEHVDQHKKHMEEVYSKLRVTKVLPFDTEPYREGFGLYVSFKGYVGDHATNRLGNKSAVGFRRGLPFRRGGRGGVRGGRGGRQWAPERGRISVHERLGPRQPAFAPPPPPSYNAQIERVAGVVQNLKNVTQQMQVLFNQKQQGSDWSNKRKYPSNGYDRDDYYREEGWGESWVRGGPDGGYGGDFKRRRGDEPPSRMERSDYSRDQYGSGYGGSSNWGPSGGSSWGGGSRDGWGSRGPSASQSRNGWWGR